MLDESYIQIAVELAKKGRGKVSPLPLVGSIVVKDGKIIGAAYRGSPSEESTELVALRNCKDSPEGSVLYTNLEPCTLSSSDTDSLGMIIKTKIKKIVIGVANPHPLYGGTAIKKIKKAGIEVKSGVLEKECIELNKFYIKHSVELLPYVTLKMACTLDGKIADVNGNSKWITSVESRSMVHELRSIYDAVLIGYNTLKKDNPQLTVRLVEGRNPKRIIIDGNLNINSNSEIVKKNLDGNLIIVTSKNNSNKRKIDKLMDEGVEFIFAPSKKNGTIDLLSVIKKLGQKNITSLMVEGGGKIFSSFIKNKLEDEILIYIGPKFLGGGISLTEGLGIKGLGKALNYSIKDLEKVGEDAYLRLQRR